MNLEQVRRLVRSKALNVLERVEQLEGPSQVEVEHLNAAIKYLGKAWDDCKAEFSNSSSRVTPTSSPSTTGKPPIHYTQPRRDAPPGNAKSE